MTAPRIMHDLTQGTREKIESLCLFNECKVMRDILLCICQIEDIKDFRGAPWRVFAKFASTDHVKESIKVVINMISDRQFKALTRVYTPVSKQIILSEKMTGYGRVIQLHLATLSKETFGDLVIEIIVTGLLWARVRFLALIWLGRDGGDSTNEAHILPFWQMNTISFKKYIAGFDDLMRVRTPRAAKSCAAAYSCEVLQAIMKVRNGGMHTLDASKLAQWTVSARDYIKKALCIEEPELFPNKGPDHKAMQLTQGTKQREEYCKLLGLIEKSPFIYPHCVHNWQKSLTACTTFYITCLDPSKFNSSDEFYDAFCQVAKEKVDMRLPVDNSFYDPSCQHATSQQTAKKKQRRSPQPALDMMKGLKTRVADLEESDISHAERLAELDISLKTLVEKQDALMETVNEAVAAVKAINSWVRALEQKQDPEREETIAALRPTSAESPIKRNRVRQTHQTQG